jgi:acetyltransferase-like isoleucine patch superfamily enzyme
MPHRPLRTVPIPAAAESVYQDWLDRLDTALRAPNADRNAVCTHFLRDLYLPFVPKAPEPEDAAAPADAPTGRDLLALHLDPRNITLEPEHYHEVDREAYGRVKPLLWLWEMFDRSPVGENLALGIPFRRLLASFIFRRCGRNFKAFPFVRFSFGYNMEVGDDVVIHRHVLLDDRGGIRLGDRVSISDFANVYSHTHDIVDPEQVETPLTVLGDGVRVTYHATVLAGVHMAPDSMLGALGLATRNTLPSTVHLGIPARPVRQKPGGRQDPSPPSSS